MRRVGGEVDNLFNQFHVPRTAIRRACRHVTKCLLFVVLIGISQVIAAPKTDVVVLKDGSRLIGQVKSLSRGQLTLSTNAEGTILVEWDLVAQVVSNQAFRLETQTGALYFGSLVEPEGPDHLRIKGATAQLN